jgi:hypothetical protein
MIHPLHKAGNPLCLPVIEGAPSVVIATSFESGTLLSFTNLRNTLKMSWTLVRSLRGRSLTNSSFTVESENPILINGSMTKAQATKAHLFVSLPFFYYQ